MSLYNDLGGTAAVTTALDHFYPKVLADPLSPFFEGVNIEGLKKRIEPFMAMAPGRSERLSRSNLAADSRPPRMHGPGRQRVRWILGHFEDVLKPSCA